MTRNQKYWLNRLIKNREALLDKSIEEAYKELQKVYRDTANSLIDRLEKLYKEMELMGQDNVLASHQFQYQKYYEQLHDIQEEIRKLGFQEDKILNADFTKYYKNNSRLVGEQLGIANKWDPERAKSVISQIWADDGKSYSDRIWTDKSELMSKLDSELTRIVSTGTGRNELIKDLAQQQMKNFLPALKQGVKEAMATSYYNARRVVVTELSRLYNTSTLEKYNEAGITEVQWLAEKDNRTCPYCLSMDSKRIPLQQSLGMIPAHPNCRCTWLGVVNGITYVGKEKE